MKLSRFTCSFLVCLTCLTPVIASAQAADNTQLFDRLDKVEHDVMLMQRQVARGGNATPTGGTDLNVPAGGSAQLEVRLSAIEDQLRELRGKIDESDNRIRKLNENFDKLQKDTEFRLNEISSARAQQPAMNIQQTPPGQQQPTAPSPQVSTMDSTAPGGNSSGSGSSSPTPLLGKPAGTQLNTRADNEKAVPKEDPNGFSTPRDLYNYAFRLLNQTQYEDAATAFAVFTKKFPKDPLVGNAYYWGGETFYIRRDYTNAADHFRQGFEALPEGPKAADNLLKLAMSLNALSRDKEACIVLQQIGAKFKKSSSSVIERAEQEQKRIGCKKA